MKLNIMKTVKKLKPTTQRKKDVKLLKIIETKLGIGFVSGK